MRDVRTRHASKRAGGRASGGEWAGVGGVYRWVTGGCEGGGVLKRFITTNSRSLRVS